MALPHPKSRKDKYGKKDIPNRGRVLWNFFKRTINVSEYWNAKDEVNPAKYRTLDALAHDVVIRELVMNSDDIGEARCAP
jgi:hypothetical protein